MSSGMTIPLQLSIVSTVQLLSTLITGGSLIRLTIDGITSLESQGSKGC